jgi:hypothetical protein
MPPMYREYPSNKRDSYSKRTTLGAIRNKRDIYRDKFMFNYMLRKFMRKVHNNA